MLKRTSLFLLIVTTVFNYVKAQEMPVAHQLTPSCYVATNGKIEINPGGQYTTDASAQVFLRDSLYGANYDTINSNFKNNKRIYYTYDAGGLLTESSSKTVDKNGQTWSNSQQINYQYTGYQLFDETYKSWDKSITDWILLSKTKYSYESDNSLSSIFYLLWNSATSEWDYSTKDLISFDQTLKTVSIENQKWNKTLAKWDSYLRINFTYSNGYISGKTYQSWNKSAQLWEDYQKESFTYNASKKEEVVTQVKTGSGIWENYSRQLFTYTGSALKDITSYQWDGAWKENQKVLYTFNANNLETLVITQQWAAHLGTFRNNSQDESYYTQRQIFGVNETPVNQFIVSNPLSKHASFTLTGLQERVKYQMLLISLNGSIVMNVPVTAGQTIELNSQLPEGIYMLSISSPGRNSINQKVLITE